jgi:activator of 2-hydroxyglutaryl-CoA dehydratase
MKEMLQEAKLQMNDLEYIISTGYGRKAIPFTRKAVTEIICHAKGANFLIPETRGVIDIGGQDSKVIGVDEEGAVTDFGVCPSFSKR